MFDALPYMRETRLPSLLWVKNYLNNYFVMYTRLTGSRILVWNSPPPSTFAMCTCLTRFRIRVEIASSAYLGLRII